MSAPIQFNTTTANSQLTTLATEYANGVIYGYPRPTNGIIPNVSTVDPGVAHCIKFTKNGGAFSYGSSTNGFNFTTAANKVLAKDAEVYSGVGLNVATLAFFRLWNNAGTRCLQGTAGVSGTVVMECTTTSIVVGGPVAIITFTITHP
jgi:hypothetical protein